MAFEDPALGEQATMGVLVASLTATVLGVLILRRLPGPAPMPDMKDVKA